MSEQKVCSFEVGAEVVSLCSSFGNHFEVTGFEPSTGRVVCKSLTNKLDRVRYAYLPTEITPFKPGVQFTIGKKYKINQKFTVIACEHPVSACLMLLIQLDGNYAGAHISLHHENHFVSKRTLILNDIDHVQPMK